MSELSQFAHQKPPSRKQEVRNLLAAALAFALAGAGGAAQAATQFVTNCNDLGSGSLRAAITAAMSGDVVDATGLSCSTISLSTGALAISVNDLTVSGPGADRLTVTNGAKYGRVFRHEGTGTLNLSGMTITGGVVSPNAIEAGTQGGCIYSNGIVSLGNYFVPTDAASGVVVTDCTAISTQSGVSASGGGIFARRGVALVHSVVSDAHAVAQDQASQAYAGGVNKGTSGPFTMKYSEVRDCSAEGQSAYSGGISGSFSTAVTVSHSTIANNTATTAVGGARFSTGFGGPITIDNSTISGNVASRLAGVDFDVEGLNEHGAIHLYSSTITDNHATSMDATLPAGAYFTGAVDIQNTIVADNFNGSNAFDLSFRISTGSTGANNLFGVANALPSGIARIAATDAKLGPLANRGGFTRVHLLLPNSPAINAGNNVSGSTTDQRGPGFPRIIGSAPDIGSSEFDPDRIFNNGFD